MEIKPIVFLDKDNNLCTGKLETNNVSTFITVCDQFKEHAGSLMCYREDDKVIIASINCRQKFQGKGFGTKMISIMESTIDKDIRCITGEFAPFQTRVDFLMFGKDPNFKLNARMFYSKNKYKIVTYKEFLNNKYENMKREDFYIIGDRSKKIIFKDGILLGEPSFILDNGTLVEKAYCLVKKGEGRL